MRVKKYSIEPIEVKFHGFMSAISVAIESYEIGSQDIPPMTISFYDELGSKKFELKTTMLDEPFASWGTDDSVVIDYVCDILGLVRV